MQLFDLVLIAKISVTALAVVIPLFAVPVRVSAPLLGLEPVQMRYLRLYGLAVAALLIGYASAFSWWRPDGFPTGIALMGLVSNGGAALLLLFDRHMPVLRWGAAFFGAVAVALLASLIAPDWALQPV